MNHSNIAAGSVKAGQRGVALVASLIILVLMTLIGLSVINGNKYLEKNAGNTRDKQRAFQAAQSALQYGEWWLNYGTNNVNFQTCGSGGTAPSTLRICNVDPGTSTANLATIPFVTYQPGSMTVASSGSSGGLVDSTNPTSDVLYSQAPGVYINCISCGTSLSSGLNLYRVTAIGYGGAGGANGTVAIVQSVYAAGTPTPPPVLLTNP